MKDKNEHINLLKEVHDSIVSLIQRDISAQEARARYNRLKDTYNLLTSDTIDMENIQLASSLCRHHNAENFSKFTALYNTQITDKPLIYSGEEQFIQLMENQIAELAPVSSGKTESHQILETDGLTYSLYSHKLKAADDLSFFSVTSSPYFRQSKFEAISDILSSLISQEKESYSSLHFETESDLTNSIKSIIQNSESHESLTIHIFIFQHLEEIFSEHGIETIAKATLALHNIIENEHTDIKCLVQTSINTCILLAGSPVSETKKKLFFTYNGISIPYKSISIDLHEKSFYQILSEIATFEQYILNGEINA